MSKMSGGGRHFQPLTDLTAIFQSVSVTDAKLLGFSVKPSVWHLDRLTFLFDWPSLDIYFSSSQSSSPRLQDIEFILFRIDWSLSCNHGLHDCDDEFTLLELDPNFWGENYLNLVWIIIAAVKGWMWEQQKTICWHVGLTSDALLNRQPATPGWTEW